MSDAATGVEPDIDVDPYPVIDLRDPRRGSPLVSEPPEWMSERGIAAWSRLQERGVWVREIDRDEFIMYCEAIAEYEEATELLRDTGLVIIDPLSGSPVPNPIISMRDSAERKVNRWSRMFKEVQ